MLENPFAKVRPKLVTARIELMSQLAKFGPDELTIASGEWSALEIAYHVYLADGLMLEQLERVQDEDDPLIENVGSEETLEAGRPSDPPASLDLVLGGMAARREELFEFLHALPTDAWERPLRHPTLGSLKFYQLVNGLSQHDRAHASQLGNLKLSITPTQA